MVVAFSYPFGKDDDAPQTLSVRLFTPSHTDHPVDFIGRHNGLHTRRYIRHLMGLSDMAAHFTHTPPIFKTMRKGCPLLRTCGIDLAKQRPDGTWAVRPDTHPLTTVTYRVMDIQIVLSLAGYTLIRTDPRTRWTVWQHPA